MRRQKDIALAQWEASKGEALRYRQRMEHQNREIKELKEALDTERMKMQVGHFLFYILLCVLLFICFCYFVINLFQKMKIVNVCLP